MDISIEIVDFRYCGEFKDDRKSGRGVENWVDGS